MEDYADKLSQHGNRMSNLSGATGFSAGKLSEDQES
jgi:hypothetical protein